MLKSEMEARIAELEAQVAKLEEELGAEKLNGEAINDCRGMLADIGHRGTFFDDVVARAVQEIKALRYDQERFRKVRESTWTMVPEGVRGGEYPKRKATTDIAMWAAVAG